MEPVMLLHPQHAACTQETVMRDSALSHKATHDQVDHNRCIGFCPQQLRVLLCTLITAHHTCTLPPASLLSCMPPCTHLHIHKVVLLADQPPSCIFKSNARQRQLLLQHQGLPPVGADDDLLVLRDGTQQGDAQHLLWCVHDGKASQHDRKTAQHLPQLKPCRSSGLLKRIDLLCKVHAELLSWQKEG